MTNHYDFYSHLNLSKTMTSQEIGQELNSRLTQLHSQGVPEQDARVQEQLAAMAILANPMNREKYDSRLADDSAPDMTISSLRTLAQTGSFGDNHVSPTPGATPSVPDSQSTTPLSSPDDDSTTVMNSTKKGDSANESPTQVVPSVSDSASSGSAPSDDKDSEKTASFGPGAANAVGMAGAAGVAGVAGAAGLAGTSKHSADSSMSASPNMPSSSNMPSASSMPTASTGSPAFSSSQSQPMHNQVDREQSQFNQPMASQMQNQQMQSQQAPAQQMQAASAPKPAANYIDVPELSDNPGYKELIDRLPMIPKVLAGLLTGISAVSAINLLLNMVRSFLLDDGSSSSSSSLDFSGFDDVLTAATMPVSLTMSLLVIVICMNWVGRVLRGRDATYAIPFGATFGALAVISLAHLGLAIFVDEGFDIAVAIVGVLVFGAVVALGFMPDTQQWFKGKMKDPSQQPAPANVAPQQFGSATPQAQQPQQQMQQQDPSQFFQNPQDQQKNSSQGFGQ
ncbi:hypothetical protein [Corynebacterium sp. H113]|uniref:hypothetical protein n=1 Tax=Corynebacterium sp. H113 TaxID=3133419 RepID=UPI003094EC96